MPTSRIMSMLYVGRYGLSGVDAMFRLLSAGGKASACSPICCLMRRLSPALTITSSLAKLRIRASASQARPHTIPIVELGLS